MLILTLYSVLFMKILRRSPFLLLESKLVGFVVLVCSDLLDIIYCVTNFFSYFLLATRNVESSLWPTHSMNIGYISQMCFIYYQLAKCWCYLEHVL